MISPSEMDRDVVGVYRASLAEMVLAIGSAGVMAVRDRFFIGIENVVQKHIGSRVRHAAGQAAVCACYQRMVGLRGFNPKDTDLAPLFREISPEVMAELERLALGGWMEIFVQAEKHYRAGDLLGDWRAVRTPVDGVGFHYEVQYTLRARTPRWEPLT